ncbi:styrene monooxygenase/indole monooxygenase family protein [Actinoplanes rectilineatus]|uniref:styrene monooxygenase/indole monooxygenase family protein n=1 Tax=Actinoplanes rectilineatus TaxID=113571 RepID=UPI0005F2F651|nr:styrene monooxygenase/indole monooxygenase family protein [Actinoplanes rectilineatus]
MRDILIVGAGQAGLQLTHALLDDGYTVTLLSARTPAELRGGNPLSTQMLFGPALEIERRLGLDARMDETPPAYGLRVTLSGPGQPTPQADLIGTLDVPARSCDQRVKMADWLELAEERGATVIHQAVTAADLDALTRSGRYDLTVVAAGRGDLTSLFEHDPDRSPYTAPQRVLAVSYVHGLRPSPAWADGHVVNHTVAGLGELFIMPTLTGTGPADILFFTAVPGGPLADWSPALSPTDHLDRTLAMIRTHLPTEVADRCRDVTLVDDRSTLRGSVTPAVRRPVAALPGGGLALGLADVVITNDPLTGQGANSAAKAADHYHRAILAHGDRPFDRTWMTDTFETFWHGYGRAVTDWTNLMLGPPPAHVQQLLGAATAHPPTARRLAAGFADPTDFDAWFMTEPAATSYLAGLHQKA